MKIRKIRYSLLELVIAASFSGILLALNLFRRPYFYLSESDYYTPIGYGWPLRCVEPIRSQDFNGFMGMRYLIINDSSGITYNVDFVFSVLNIIICVFLVLTFVIIMRRVAGIAHSPPSE
ncbi:MAG: hypothetical protein HY291_18150 [Planctomycetes bacterium]|nr:hypothetical protein [Planctomycetota bacterium]